MAKKSVFNLDQNVASALAYLGLMFSGLFFLVMERENKEVRFHALQSTITFSFLWVLRFVLRLFPIFGGMFASIVSFVICAAVIVLVFMAFMGRTFKVPIVGEIVWNTINR